MTCDELRTFAPELALGALTGTERAAALGHLAACGSCSEYVDELAAVADGLLLLAPEDEPDAGFETRVIARSAATNAPRRPNRRRAWAVGASIAAGVVMAAGIGGERAYRLDRRQMGLNRDYVS